MTTRTVTGTIYNPKDDGPWNNAEVIFRLRTAHATATNGSVMQRQVTALTDLNGDFSVDLAVPDVDAWQWQANLPDGNVFTFNLEAGASINLHTLQADNNLGATVSPSDITPLISGKADKVSPATAGNLLEMDAGGDPQDAGVPVSSLATAASVTTAVQASANFRSTTALAATATSATLNAEPDSVGTNLGWLVFSPFSTNCEIRKIASKSGADVTFAALNNTHAINSPIKVIDRPVWSVGLFGAVYDGTTNDAAAFQAAVDDCPANGVVDISGDGNALINTGVTISKGVEIVRRSGTITLSGVDLFTVNGGSGYDVTVDGVKLVGGNGGSVFRLPATFNLRNVTVKNCEAQAGNIAIRGSIDGTLLIADNILGDPDYVDVAGKIQIAPTDTPEYVREAIVRNNTVNGDNTAAVDLIEANGVTDRLILTGNRARGTGTNADCYDLDAGVRYAVITNNYAYDGDIGFEVKEGTRHDTEVGEKVIFANNYALECNRGIIFRLEGVIEGNTVYNSNVTSTTDLTITAKTGVSVIGNTLISDSQRGILVDTLASGVSITGGNVIKGQSEGINFSSGSNHQVTGGNVIEASTPITFSNNVLGSNCVVMGNELVSTGSFCVRVREGGPWTDITIKDNICSGYSSRPVEVLGTSTAYVDVITQFTDADATPSVTAGAYGNTFVTANTGATTITQFDDGLEGQVIRVHMGDANTTIADNANIVTSTGADILPYLNLVVVLQKRGTVWYEVSKSALVDLIANASSASATPLSVVADASPSVNLFEILTGATTVHEFNQLGEVYFGQDKTTSGSNGNLVVSTASSNTRFNVRRTGSGTEFFVRTLSSSAELGMSTNQALRFRANNALVAESATDGSWRYGGTGGTNLGTIHALRLNSGQLAIYHDGPIGGGIDTFADADATPSVQDASVFVTANTGATTITNFDDGVDGQYLEVHAGDANTTIQDGANIATASGANVVLALDQVIKFRRRSSVWYEI